MPSRTELNAEWKRFNGIRKSKGKSHLTFRKWYKERYGAEPPDFLSEKQGKPNTQDADSNIGDYILSKIGTEPNASGSKRRWHFLGIMAEYIFQQKRIGMNDFFKWTTAHCQCMKMRTLREDYLDTLERLEMIRLDGVTGSICWVGECNG